jgi:uncharacterized membrane protein
LERYEKLLPGSAEMIFTVFKDQVSQRHRLETDESRRMDWGLASAFIIVIMIVGAGTFLVFAGHDWAGAGLIGANIVGLAAIFISGPTRRRARKSAQDSDFHTNS